MPETKTYNDSMLSKDELENFTFTRRRVQRLQETRKSHFGTDLDALFSDADRDCVPHRLNSKGKRVVATDEERGWRGSMVRLNSNDWQSDLSKSNPFTKIQIALAILVDQNPSGVFSPTAKKYEKTTKLVKELYQHSWEYAKSKEQLKLFVYNLAKYGWAIARTYPMKSPAMGYDDIFRENLDPRNCWIDDMTRPGNPWSMRDWTWRKVYALDAFKDEFKKYPRALMVTAGGNTQDTLSGKTPEKDSAEEELVEVLFYENRMKDIFCVIANGVPVILEALPVADSEGLKKLSCWQTYWVLRHAQSPYGVGIYEAAKYDNALLDRLRNMTIDQLTLSIYKMFFYQGTQSLTETGDIEITPGRGKQVLDPKNMNWLDVPGPGAEAWQGLEMAQKDVDTSSGIGDPLEGDVTGKTAFELAQAKEAALKRLKTPLGNVLDALNEEGYITISLMQMLYSVPEVYAITDPALIEEYLRETKSDPELFDRTEDSMDEEGNPVPGKFMAKVYPEFPLNLDEDEKGNLVQTKETKFFRIKPSSLQWEGIINIKAQSILSTSKQVDKALDLEMFNMLIPLLIQPPEIYGKIAKAIVKLYDKDPEDLLPDAWLNPETKEEPLFVPQGQVINQQLQDQGVLPPQGPTPAPTAPTMVSRTQGASNPQSLIGKISSRLTTPFRA